MYVSTRNSAAEPVCSAIAIKNGLAPDGGLYMPKEIPTLTEGELGSLLRLPYAERCAEVLSRFLTDFTKEDIAIYFEISSNPNSIDYPNVIYNGASYVVNFIEGKYVAIIEDIKYGTQANLYIDGDSLMTGVSFVRWADINGQEITTSLSLPTNIEIKGNAEYRVILQYTKYSIHFVSVNMAGETCKYGYGTLKNGTSFILNQAVEYNVYINPGYVLSSTYYYDNNNQKQEGVQSGFVFEPSKYLIDDNIFTIYLQFNLKEVKVVIDNVMHEDSSNTLGITPSEWATFSVSRIRNGQEAELLTSTDEYLFQTGDTLSVIIKPITLGIELTHVNFGDDSKSTNIGFGGQSPYSLNSNDIYENDKIEGVRYYLQIIFNHDIIDPFNAEVNINNVFKVKQYNVLYTYNLKSKECGVELMVRNNGAISSPGADNDYVQTVNYGSQMTFTVNSSTISLISDKFEVLGFKLNGVLDENDKRTTYLLNNMDMWKEIARERYSISSTQIKIELTLSPKITLKNTDLNDPFKYTRTYNSQSQSLIVGTDVIVAEAFKLTIEYYDSTGDKVNPVNVDVYDVRIFADDGDGQLLSFGRTVTLVIIPAKVTLNTIYSSTNPLTKVYDGSTIVNKEALINGLILDGVYEKDKNIIVIDQGQIKANYSDSRVSKTERRHITIKDVYIIDKTTNSAPRNYKLENGETSFIMRESGHISARPLVITGFKIGDKVYDGTSEVKVDVSNITFNGLVPTDSASIEPQNLRFYCETFTIGYDREVKLDYSNALTGSDSLNYNISYSPSYIDIYPYELALNINGYGEFKLVDYDKKCLIPIEAKLKVNVYDTDSVQYRELYSVVEQAMEAKEKFRVVYEVSMQTGVITKDLPEGLYLYMPSVSKLSKVILTNGETAEAVKHSVQDGVVIIKTGGSSAMICVISETIYLPLWQILLIVLAVGIIIAVLILIFIIIRRKKKNKYSVNDRI